MNLLLTVALIFFFGGVLILAAGGWSYSYRAFRNLPAWNGLTKPLLLIGLPVFLIGLALIVVFFAQLPG